ncbi:MAG: hypothetical protein JJU28_13670 [Cyclobacteriaceae bacterium]|nr:hypothetical protein [Cyclobacteriaceae bacterium]
MRILFALILSAWFILPAHRANAQFVPGAFDYDELSLLFSQINYTGSARIQGMGGAQVALGGDISSALSNPAGLGFYNRSEFSFTPSVNTLNNRSTYLGNQTNDMRTRFNIDNLGVVFNRTRPDHKPGAWRGGSFAISYSKVAEYNSNVFFSGMNPYNDIIDMFVQQANFQDVNPNQLGGLPRRAFDTYMISEFNDVFSTPQGEVASPFYERTFFWEFPNEDFPTRQSEQIETRGSQNYLSFAGGGNFDDLIYIGAGLNISTLNFIQSKFYREEYPTGSIMQRTSLSETLELDGTGISGSFGVIGRIMDNMTLGVSLITPTYYLFNETYFSRLQAIYNNFNMRDYADLFLANEDLIIPADPAPGYQFTFLDYEENVTLRTENSDISDSDFFEWNLTTPMRINGGLAYFLGKSGFITADIEYVDYSTMNIRGRGVSLFDQNQRARSNFTNTINLRFGGEWRISSFRARAGFASFGDPYRSRAGSGDGNRTRQVVSLGGGYRSNTFFIDLAAVTTFANSLYAPYTVDAVDNPALVRTNFADIQHRDLHFRLTIGFFF